jgi:hypothetical protein
MHTNVTASLQQPGHTQQQNPDLPARRLADAHNASTLGNAVEASRRAAHTPAVAASVKQSTAVPLPSSSMLVFTENNLERTCAHRHSAGSGHCSASFKHSTRVTRGAADMHKCASVLPPMGNIASNTMCAALGIHHTQAAASHNKHLQPDISREHTQAVSIGVAKANTNTTVVSVSCRIHTAYYNKCC